MNDEERFSFAISLSVLNHLGRNLYRSFATVLGEAISNAWDADAKNVWIEVNRENSAMLVKDDGIGMTSDDFRNKFLKIGYSKRHSGQSRSASGRPYIGQKGIGKLAMLSCAKKIAVITKTAQTDYVGGLIDNSDLDDAINDDLIPSEYPLESVDFSLFETHTQDHEHGTIIYFDNLNEGIKNTVEHLKKIIALYFRFSLLDDEFNIHVDGDLVNVSYLQDLIDKTQFMWEINLLDDPLIAKIKDAFTEEDNEDKVLNIDPRVQGFIATTELPSHLNILGTGEKVGIDLFVNGRLREKNILSHIPSARIVESYAYGQIHFNTLDDGGTNDRFTSNREGVVGDDALFNELLEILKNDVMSVIISDWDKWRIKHKDDGDSENDRISKKERKSGELYNAVAKEFKPEDNQTEEAKKVEGWVDSLGEDATFNFASYAECFMAENLVRKFVEDQSVPLSPEAIRDIEDWKNKESQNKTNGNVSIEIRKNGSDLSYLDMAGLSTLVDNNPGQTTGLPRDTKQYRPIRDAMMHTALLSDEAKRMLSTCFDNIKARVKSLLS